MHYARHVIGYHGCEKTTAELVLSGGEFTPSNNDFDWLGSAGSTVWIVRSAGPRSGARRGGEPAAIGAYLALGECFDLLDTRYTNILAGAHERWKRRTPKHRRPENTGKLARLDCAVLNWYLEFVERREGHRFDAVRCVFVEGAPVFPASLIHEQSHIQIAVRNPACVIGVFRPIMMGRS